MWRLGRNEDCLDRHWHRLKGNRRKTTVNWQFKTQEPPKGVYNGMIPCWISQSTKLGVLWPLRLSQTKSIRSGGKSSGNGGGWSSPVHQLFHNARLISGSKTSVGVGHLDGDPLALSGNSAGRNGYDHVK